MRLGLKVILLGLFLSAPGLIASSASNDERVDLSEEEREWIANHPSIRTGIVTDRPPFSYYDSKGKIAGIDLDLLKIVSERTGLKFETVPSPSWDEMLTTSKGNRLEMVTSAAETLARLMNFSFTRPYHISDVVIVTREGDGDFSHISVLRGVTVAMPRRHASTSAFAERCPSAKLILAETQAECFKLVAQKKAAATVANLFITTLYLNEYPADKLKICGVIAELGLPLCFAVQRENATLVGILDKALASVSQDELDDITSKHIEFALQGGRRVGLLQLRILQLLVGAVAVGVMLFVWNYSCRKEVQARRIAEAELREANNKLREANQSMEVFSHSLSHDLKGPLRTISGFAEVLKEDYHDKLDRHGQEYLDKIISGASRMNHLMCDVLAYSRTSRLESPLQTVSLDPLVHQVIDEFPTVQREYFHIVSALPDVQGNPTLLTQCITNLLSNAIKFVPKERTPQIRIRAEPENSFVKLWVEDNGIGIAPENLQRIFKMFERGAPSEYEGTGVGLAVVAKAVERIGGNVGVESELGKGSRFWIRLVVHQR